MVGAAMLWATAGYAQDAPSGQTSSGGTYIDGVFVPEAYVYKPQYISPQALKKLIDEKSKNIVIVDTAAPLIFQEQHIPGAVDFPWPQTASQPVTLPRDKTLVLYCACNHEEDSIAVAKKLVESGYHNLKVLKGGWFTWTDLGYKVTGSDAKSSGSKG
ncbi:MAG: rhodanese-like domain-containing protein [Candidatus Binataceae bacterium]